MLDTARADFAPFAALRRFPAQTAARRRIKRAEDVAIATALLVLLALPLALIALAIRLDSPGGALFRQVRAGLHGRPFVMLKFRTMRVEEADVTGKCQTVPDDPRLTGLGKLLRRTSVDELPQLFNVLRGDMSLVGPRPHAVETSLAGRKLDLISPYYAARHQMKPGMTGLAQVLGLRGPLTSEAALAARVEADLRYIESWSLIQDLAILARTAALVASLRSEAF
jgi:lipopolysaccharide/colanic/teichoic acid biosynthesis glycosyltransferase